MTASDSLVERLRHVDTTSLSDADKRLRVLPPTIRPIVVGRRMIGRAVTADANGDLRSVLAGLERSGDGDVLVVAGAGDTHAVVGELFSTEAIRRGLAGIVIDGLCRDTAMLARLSIPVYARGRTPQAAPAKGVPVVQTPVLVGGIEILPGDLLVGDDDGIVVGTVEQIEAAIEAAEAIQHREAALRAAIEGGASLFEQKLFG